MIGTRILNRNSAIGTVLNTIVSNSPVFYSSKQFAFNDNCCWRQSAIDAIYIQFVVWWGGYTAVIYRRQIFAFIFPVVCMQGCLRYTNVAIQSRGTKGNRIWGMTL